MYDANGRINLDSVLDTTKIYYRVTCNILSPAFYTCTTPFVIISESQGVQQQRWWVRAYEDVSNTSLANAQVIVRICWQDD